MVFLIDDELKTYQDVDFVKFEHENKFKLPKSYKKFMSQFGAGIYCGFLRVHALEDILSKTKDSRELWKEYPEFFWPQSKKVIKLKGALRCYDFADSIGGDVMAFEPKTGNFIVFPRHSNNLFIVKGGFDDPLNWSPHIDTSCLSPLTFSPVHNVMSKTLVMERKWAKLSDKAGRIENISAHMENIEALHVDEEYLKASDEDTEIIYSKRWAGEIVVSKFSYDDGDRLRVDMNFNKKNVALVEADMEKLFTTDYERILSETS